ncbi:hypothetical protein AZH11_12690 [Pseudomonas simiae]|nr:hypothetical protein AZH11_12690 [Pseudomonas simiae]
MLPSLHTQAKFLGRLDRCRNQFCITLNCSKHILRIDSFMVAFNKFFFCLDVFRFRYIGQAHVGVGALDVIAAALWLNPNER